MCCLKGGIVIKWYWPRNYLASDGVKFRVLLVACVVTVYPLSFPEKDYYQCKRLAIPLTVDEPFGLGGFSSASDRRMNKQSTFKLNCLSLSNLVKCLSISDKSYRISSQSGIGR